MAERLKRGDQGWERPDWLRRTLAAVLAVGQVHANYDDIERQLMSALVARLKYRARDPPVVGERRDALREEVYINAKEALEAMSREQPYLASRMYVDAVTSPQPAGRD